MGAQATELVAPTLGRNSINGLKHGNQDFLMITFLEWMQTHQIRLFWLPPVITSTYWISNSIWSSWKLEIDATQWTQVGDSFVTLTKGMFEVQNSVSSLEIYPFNGVLIKHWWPAWVSHSCFSTFWKPWCLASLTTLMSHFHWSCFVWIIKMILFFFGCSFSHTLLVCWPGPRRSVPHAAFSSWQL